MLLAKVGATARSSELSTKQLTLLSAALRHARDAEHLLEVENRGRSVDQAFHLAGFGPECVRKALLSDRVFDKVLGHRFDSGAEVVLDVVLALDPRARRYAPRGWASRYPSLVEWSEQSRYRRTGTYDSSVTTPLVEQAARAVRETLAVLFADGCLPSGFAW